MGPVFQGKGCFAEAEFIAGFACLKVTAFMPENWRGIHIRSRDSEWDGCHQKMV